jgi:predicted metal-dependent phosphotriesterase family hydrolase
MDSEEPATREHIALSQNRHVQSPGRDVAVHTRRKTIPFHKADSGPDSANLYSLTSVCFDSMGRTFFFSKETSKQTIHDSFRLSMNQQMLMSLASTRLVVIPNRRM